MMKNKLFASLVFAVPAVMVVSSVVPVLNATAEVNAPTIGGVVYTIDNQQVELSFDYFTQALNAEVLTDLNLGYVKLSDGKYYSFTTFTAALNAFDTLGEATTNLASNSSLQQPLTGVVTGDVDLTTGKVIVKDVVVSDFEVIGIE